MLIMLQDLECELTTTATTRFGLNRSHQSLTDATTLKFGQYRQVVDID
jgi:hypothetical protein